MLFVSGVIAEHILVLIGDFVIVLQILYILIDMCYFGMDIFVRIGYFPSCIFYRLIVVIAHLFLQILNLLLLRLLYLLHLVTTLHLVI